MALNLDCESVVEFLGNVLRRWIWVYSWVSLSREPSYPFPIAFSIIKQVDLQQRRWTKNTWNLKPKSGINQKFGQKWND